MQQRSDPFDAQMPLFDETMAVEQRDKALEEVVAGQEKWVEKILSFVRGLRSGWCGSGEDIRKMWWDRMGEQPRHHNAWGAAIRLCIVRGLLRRTGRRIKLTSLKGHARLTDEYERI